MSTTAILTASQYGNVNGSVIYLKRSLSATGMKETSGKK